ncbi:hypothetical protein VTK73DRAFT_4140 [Phialemonium thermophilum]|uniref:Uncharacterized protein n=1 Tax=Phialemonium thermophilum TaxID=223376 RepID=A0ABR3WVS3_9PEZI
MVLELFSAYRWVHQDAPDAWQRVDQWLCDTTRELRGVVAQAQTACARLTQDRVRPTQLGFGSKQDTPRQILQVLGWSEPVQAPPDDLTKETDSDSVSSLQKQLGSAADATTTRLQSAARPVGGSHWERQSPRATPDSAATPDANDAAAQPPLGTDPPDRRWDVFHLPTLVRLLVYAYVLSKYKAFSFYNGTPNGSLQPRAADERTLQLMRGHWDPNSGGVKRPGIRRLENEFRDMQIWLSELSCAWLHSLAERSSLCGHLGSFVASTTQRSRLGLLAAACYPGYLLEREFLARECPPVLLVDRHFCPHGYHVNVFEASIEVAKNSKSSTLLELLAQCLFRVKSRLDAQPAAHQTPLGLALQWRISTLSIDALIAQNEPTTPRLVVMGNSLRGAHKDYTDILQESIRAGDRRCRSLPHVPPPGQTCEDNDSHVRQFVQADHDRIALAFFAVHPAYSFQLDADEDEITFVEKKMDSWETAHQDNRGKGGSRALARLWRASREEADLLGVGTESMHLFRWQHAFAESKGRLGKLLARSLEEADLMPLKSPATCDGAELQKSEATKSI